MLLPAHIGHILAEHEDPRIARHLVAEAPIQEVDHGRRVAAELGRVLGVELLRRRIDGRGVHIEERRFGLGLRGRQRQIDGDEDFLLDVLLDGLQLRFGRDPLGEQLRRERDDAVPLGLLFSLTGRLIQHFIVRQGVRVGARYVRVDERRALPLTAMRGRANEDIVRRQGSQPFTASTKRSGNPATSFEMVPPAVCTSTGTEIA